MMTRQQIVEGIYALLRPELPPEASSSFSCLSRLREDLGLDSSAVLQLLVRLELELGLPVPEDAVMKNDFETVGAVAKILHDAARLGRPGAFLEYEEDIKLHCVVSCLSEVIKRKGIDQRPLYFGVWDAELAVDDRYTISYHGADVGHDFLVRWAEQLYGLKVAAWYDPSKTKDDNAAALASLVEGRAAHEHIMVMLDMFQLPERVNEFNKDPFPHYLMLGATPDPERWMVYDPDYRYEGVTEKRRVLNAVRHPDVFGGYRIDDSAAREPDARTIKAYYDACVRLDENPMTAAVRRTVTAHLEGRSACGEPLPLAHLQEALAELPILSIRKYAYEHGLAFFIRELGLDEEEFDHWCDVIEALVKTYRLVQFQSLKLAVSGSREVADAVFRSLEEQDERERAIKHRLDELCQRWWTSADRTDAWASNAEVRS